MNSPANLLSSCLAALLLGSCAFSHESKTETDPVSGIVKKETKTKAAVGGKGEFGADGSIKYDNEKSFGHAAATVSGIAAGHQLLEGQRSNNALEAAKSADGVKTTRITEGAKVKITKSNNAVEALKHAPVE